MVSGIFLRLLILYACCESFSVLLQREVYTGEEGSGGRDCGSIRQSSTQDGGRGGQGGGGQWLRSIEGNQQREEKEKKKEKKTEITQIRELSKIEKGKRYYWYRFVALSPQKIIHECTVFKIKEKEA